MQSRILPYLLSPVLALAASTVVAADWKPEPLPKDEEIRQALAAGPETIRDDAGVYVLTDKGFELTRKSKNGFHCIIGRTQPDAFEPQCLDAEGSSTLLHQILLRGRLQMSGLSSQEVTSKLKEAWDRGELKPPSQPGINYMLSKHNRVPVGPEQVIHYRPHVMFYAPYLTNKDFGGDMQGKSPIFLINEGLPSAYVIVPVPQEDDQHATGP